jgi:hypothetical protein
MSVPDVPATLLSPVAWRAPFALTAAVLALTAVFFSAVALPLATDTTALASSGLAPDARFFTLGHSRAG